MTCEVARLTDRVDMNAVGYCTGHAQHPGVYGGDVDLGIGRVDRPGAPLRTDEVKIVKLTVMIKRACPECGEARFDREHVVPQTGAGTLEGHAVPAHHMAANLSAETEPESPVGRLLQFPGGRRGDKGTTRKSDRDSGREFEARRRLRCHGGAEVGGPSGFGE